MKTFVKNESIIEVSETETKKIHWLIVHGWVEVV